MRAGKVEFYRDDAGQWRWRIVASNGRILADSGEGYSRRKDCENGLYRVTNEAGKWDWRAPSNGRHEATGGAADAARSTAHNR